MTDNARARHRIPILALFGLVLGANALAYPGHATVCNRMPFDVLAAYTDGAVGSGLPGPNYFVEPDYTVRGWEVIRPGQCRDFYFDGLRSDFYARSSDGRWEWTPGEGDFWSDGHYNHICVGTGARSFGEYTYPHDIDGATYCEPGFKRIVGGIIAKDSPFFSDITFGDYELTRSNAYTAPADGDTSSAPVPPSEREIMNEKIAKKKAELDALEAEERRLKEEEERCKSELAALVGVDILHVSPERLRELAVCKAELADAADKAEKLQKEIASRLEEVRSYLDTLLAETGTAMERAGIDPGDPSLVGEIPGLSDLMLPEVMGLDVGPESDFYTDLSVNRYRAGVFTGIVAEGLRREFLIATKAWAETFRALDTTDETLARTLDYLAAVTGMAAYFEGVEIPEESPPLVPEELLDAIRAVVAPKSPDKAEALEKALLSWRGEALSPHQSLVLETVRLLVEGFRNLDVAEVGASSAARERLDGLIEEAALVAGTLGENGQFFAGNEFRFACEMASGRAECSPASGQMPLSARVFSAIQLTQSQQGVYAAMNAYLLTLPAAERQAVQTSPPLQFSLMGRLVVQ